MGVVCKNCSKPKISFLEALAYSGNGSMRCSSCGKLSKLGKLFSFLYLILEGVIVLISLALSFYFLMAWPLILAIVLLGGVRVFLLPLFSQPVSKKKNVRSEEGKNSVQVH